jgi:hypothetical protein
MVAILEMKKDCRDCHFFRRRYDTRYDLVDLNNLGRCSHPRFTKEVDITEMPYASSMRIHKCGERGKYFKSDVGIKEYTKLELLKELMIKRSCDVMASINQFFKIKSVQKASKTLETIVLFPRDVVRRFD